MVDLDVGDFVETLDAEYDAVATRGEGVDAVFIRWSDDPALAAICEYSKSKTYFFIIIGRLPC